MIKNKNSEIKIIQPLEVFEKLSKFIIGQDEAKRAISIACSNRLRRMNVDKTIAKKIMPKNVLMIGSTGVGKTEIARRLAEILNAPFIIIALSQYTEIGYYGNNVSSIVSDLLEKRLQKNKEDQCLIIKEKEKEKIYEKLAKAYIRSKTKSDEEVKIEEIIQKIKNKELDNEEINIETELNAIEEQRNIDSDTGNINELQLAIIPIMTNNIKNNYFFNNQKKFLKKKKIKMEKAFNLLLENEVQSKLNEEEIIANSMKEVEENGIIFLDEIDKIISNKNENSSRGEVSREGVQKDLIPLIEGTVVHTKYGPIKTDHILFIGAGAFHVSSPEDLMSELKGRFAIKIKLNNLTESDYLKILKDVDFSILDQYKKLLEVENLKLEFTQDGIEEIAKITTKINSSEANLGARRLHTVIENVLEKIMFEGNSNKNNKEKTITINTEYIKEVIKSKNIEEEVNLRKFII